MFIPQEIIRRKRDGAELGEDEIAAFVRGFRDGSIAEGQIAAFAMAVFFRGMSRAEATALARAMKRSGEVLEWSDLALPGPLLDKHSTGGVGDKTSLMVAPIVAACGGFVPMIAGRALGHTGGTVDKLDSIPGYRSAPAIGEFRHIVREIGCAIIGQTANLAPADRRFYAIRDITATVESTALITASILAKKQAAGLDGLVMDVKTGSGAFLPGQQDALELPRSVVALAAPAGPGSYRPRRRALRSRAARRRGRPGASARHHPRPLAGGRRGGLGDIGGGLRDRRCAAAAASRPRPAHRPALGIAGGAGKRRCVRPSADLRSNSHATTERR